MKKLTIAILIFLLTACGEPASGTVRAVVSASPASVEATSTTESVPQSILEQMPLLQEHGYSLQQAQVGWELVDAQGQVVLSTTEPLTISARAGNNEMLLVPSTSFLVRETIAAGVPIILTFKDSAHETNPAHFYLDRTGEWATPIEIYNDFENLEQCPRIDIQDVWSGRLLYSAELAVEPLPNDTLVPDEFMYAVRQGSQGFSVSLYDKVNGALDGDAGMTRRGIHKSNDYREQVLCAVSTTPNGEEILITGEQVKTPDGKRMFQFSNWGAEWSWSEGHPYASKPGGNLYSVQDSILLAKTDLPPAGYVATTTRPIVYFEYPGLNDINRAFGIVEEGSPDTAGVALYFLPENNPLKKYPEIIEKLISAGQAGEEINVTAGEEIADFQYALFIGNTTGRSAVPPEYFD